MYIYIFNREYANNIRIVDEGIRKTSKIFEKFYKDSRTAFIFTSDHGMTNWGNYYYITYFKKVFVSVRIFTIKDT